MRNSRQFSVVGLGVVHAIVLHAQSASLKIEVTDPRPLAAACTKIQGMSWIPINYEDAPYAYPGDLKDVTEEVLTPTQRANAAPDFRLISPRGGTLSVVVPGESEILKIHSLEWAHDAVMAAVDAHSASYSQSFVVEQGEGVLFVRPDQLKDKGGSVQRVIPVLSTRVSFPFELRSAYATLQLITDLVSKATGSQVHAGLLPMKLFMAANIQIGADNEPARIVVVRLFHAMATVREMPALSYQLNYDVNLKPDYYGMTISMVPRTTPVPARRELPPAPSQAPPDANPFFKKSGNGS